MRKISTFIIFLALALVLGGGTFLMTWDIPAPTSDIEEVLPDDRFPK